MSYCTFEWQAEKEAQIGAVLCHSQVESLNWHWEMSQMDVTGVSWFHCSFAKRQLTIVQKLNTIPISWNSQSPNPPLTSVKMFWVSISCWGWVSPAICFPLELPSSQFPPTFSILKVSNSHLLPRYLVHFNTLQWSSFFSVAVLCQCRNAMRILAIPVNCRFFQSDT